MTKFLGFLIFILWTAASGFIGYFLSVEEPTPVNLAETCLEKEKFVYLVPHPDPIEEEYNNEPYLDDYFGDCGDDSDIDWREFRPRTIVKESKKKNNKTVMVGVQSSGNYEAKFNFPVSDSFGVYVGGDTGNNISVGASFSF